MKKYLLFCKNNNYNHLNKKPGGGKYMALKLVIDKLEDVAEGLRDQYKLAGDGKFHLQTDEDMESKKKIEEFRTTNITLMKKQKELEDQLKDLGDPKEIVAMRQKIQQIEDKKLIEAGKLDELVEQKVERMRNDFQAQLEALKKANETKEAELQKTTARLSEVLIDSEITKAVTAVGTVRKDAMQDIISRGKRVWRLEDGKPIPKDGDKLLFGKDGKNPLTFEEWAMILSQTAPFLFETTTGGGGTGGQHQDLSKGKEDLSKISPEERLKRIHERQDQKKA
jgi:hypothetical protein